MENRVPTCEQTDTATSARTCEPCDAIWLFARKKSSWKFHFLEVVFLHYTTILLR